MALQPRLLGKIFILGAFLVSIVKRISLPWDVRPNWTLRAPLGVRLVSTAASPIVGRVLSQLKGPELKLWVENITTLLPASIVPSAEPIFPMGISMRLQESLIVINVSATNRSGAQRIDVLGAIKSYLDKSPKFSVTFGTKGVSSVRVARISSPRGTFLFKKCLIVGIATPSFQAPSVVESA